MRQEPGLSGIALLEAVLVTEPLQKGRVETAGTDCVKSTASNTGNARVGDRLPARS